MKQHTIPPIMSQTTFDYSWTETLKVTTQLSVTEIIYHRNYTINVMYYGDSNLDLIKLSDHLHRSGKRQKQNN